MGGDIIFLLPCFCQVAAIILENTFTSILDMAGVLLPFLKWFIGKSTSRGLKILNILVRSPWNTIDVVGQVSCTLEVCLFLFFFFQVTLLMLLEESTERGEIAFI